MIRLFKIIQTRTITVLLLSLSVIQLHAQETDSLDLEFTQHLSPVVLTGQYSPQSVDKSVFEVEVISRQDIEKMAGNTLEDVLTQNLNLNIMPNPSEGRSGLQQFGFDSEYIKILVDGIPIVGDEGFGNAIDISQINLDDIQQIEIIEGSMGVQYGANAVTGVINIITQKNSRHKWQITPYIQEETIGSEYNWRNQGRHIQSLKIGHKISHKIYTEASYTRNDFRGFYGDKHGRNYANPNDANDGLRGYEWLPKLQNTAKALLSFRNGNFNAFYKFEYFDERTEKYANNVRLNPNNSTGTLNPTANDAIYRTDRYYHHFNMNGKLAQQMNYNISASIQEQKRNVENYTYVLKTGEHTHTDRYDYNTRKGFFSRGTISNFMASDWFDFEIGYEFNHDKGSASGLAEQSSSDNTKLNTIDSYSGFLSSEIKVNERISFRPGFRYIASNQFSSQYALSFSGKYLFNQGYELRAILGTSPKLPNFEQLFTYLVDSNHDVRGNENLSPEKGKSAFLHLKKSFRFNEINFQPKLSFWYLDVDDKIDLIIVNTAPLAYQYNNIDLYKTWGLALRNKFNYGRLSAGLGISFSGESKVLKNEDDFNDDYLYSVQINSELSYTVPKWDAVFSAFFKYNGPQYQFVSTFNQDGDIVVAKEKQEGYGWLNASVKKQFFDKKFEITLGARNLLDLKEIKTTTGSGLGHEVGSSSLLLGYGRSYFLKLQYNLNI